MLDQKEQRDEKSKVANAIDDECLFAGGGSGILSKPEPDQQIRSQAHALPADEHQQIIAGQNQSQHEEHKQIQIAEEAVEPALLPHVADRINVDKKANAADHQQHNDGEMIEIKRKVCLKAAYANPGSERFKVGRSQRNCLRDDPQCHGKRRAAESERHRGDGAPGKSLPQQPIDGSADQGQQRNQPEMEVRRHSLSKFTRSTFKVSRVR